jgi:DeoR family ulaG and ulaABCDEF operon transcriptional repressor
VIEEERRRTILRLLQERSILSIAELNDVSGRSLSTTRRDIGALAAQGKLLRVRGGAVAVNAGRADAAGCLPAKSDHVAVARKRAIARVAAALVGDDDSLIIAAGTTTLALVDFLAHRRLSVMTNSLSIAARLLATSENRVSMAGGMVFRDPSIIYSPLEDDATATFWARKMFLGCYGVNSRGLMEVDPLVAQAHVRLSKRTEQVIVLADSSKLSRSSSMLVLPLRSISILITDDGAQDSLLEPIARAGVNVVVASTLDDTTRSPRVMCPALAHQIDSRRPPGAWIL